MSHPGGDNGDNSASIHAWNRTPGKPNLASLAGKLSNAASWGGKLPSVDSRALLGDSNPVNDVWSAPSDSANSRKNDTSSQWPTPAELAGNSRGDAFCDFSNSWRAPGTALALRSISESHDQPDSWPNLECADSGVNTEINNAPRAITGGGNISAGNNAFNSRQHLSSLSSSSKPRGESFSSWGSQADGDFNAFPNQTIPTTSENKRPKDQAQVDEVPAPICSSVSDSGNHTDPQSESSTVINSLINTKDWGTRPVDQTTPWDITLILTEEANGVRCGTPTQSAYGKSSAMGEAVSININQRRELKGTGKAVGESNVWVSEPPNGTAIWEMHYESLGEKTQRWKQSPSTTKTGPSVAASSVVPSGSSSLGGAVVNSPPGSHRGATPSASGSAFALPNTTQPPPPLPSAPQRQFAPNFFPPQTRFGQPAVSQQVSGFSQPLGASRGGGPNGMLTGAGGAFRSLQSTAPGSAQGWPLPLTPDSPSPIDDPKRFIPPSWGDGPIRAIGKQQQQQQPDLVGRWASSPTESLWPSSDFLPANNPTSSSRPWQQPTQQLNQRFHPRQNVNNALRQNFPLLRNEVARQLMTLGFHDEAGYLLGDSTIDDVERFLCAVRDRLGGIHPGLNHLINAVSAMLPPAQQPFDVYDNRLAAAPGVFSQASTLPTKTPGGILPPPPPAQVPSSFFNKMVSSQQQQHQNDVMSQLMLRESHLRQNIAHLHKKKRELGMKHAQLHKMTGSGPTHHPHPMVQEILIQEAQISHQIEAQEAQMSQLHSQMDFVISNGGGGGSSASSRLDHQQQQEASMMMRLRGGQAVSSIRGPGGGFCGGPRGIMTTPMMMQSSPSPLPSSDISSRMGEMKLGSGMDSGRRMPWENTSAWDAPPAFHPSSVGVMGFAQPSPLDPIGTSVFSSDRRWPSQQQQPPEPLNFGDPGNRYPWGGPGTNGGSAWLLLFDLTPQFSLEVLRMSLEQARQSGGVGGDPLPEIHPNLAARFVLVGFATSVEANLASAFIANCGYKQGTVEMISTATAMSKLQEIKNLAVQTDDVEQQQNQTTVGQSVTSSQWQSSSDLKTTSANNDNN